MKTNPRKVLSFLGWVFILLVSVTLPGLFKYQWWAIITGVLPLTMRLAYEHFDEVALLVNRLFLKFSSREVAWEMSAHFDGGQNIDLRELVLAIQQKNSSVRTLQDNSDSVVITVQDKGLTIKIFNTLVHKSDDDIEMELVFQIPRVFVPFNHSTKILNYLIATIHSIKNEFSLIDEKYVFKVIFSDLNPYLGLFLRRLKVLDGVTLNVDYLEQEGANQGRVIVRKDKVSITTKDLRSLQAFSKKYITLSSLNLSDS